MVITLKHDRTNRIKQCKVGFSWTTLLFSFFVPIFRGDWKWCGIMLAFAILTCGLSAFVFCFIYNKLYINDMLDKGYKPADEHSRNILVAKGFITG